MPQDIFDSLAKKQQSPAQGDIFDQLAKQPKPGQAPPSAAPEPTGGGDIFDQLTKKQTPNPLQPESSTLGGDDPARMGEGESVLTRPLSTYLGIPEYRQGAGGVERAVEKFASGLTSPLNVGLALVTAGLGGVASAGAASAAEVAASAAGEEFAAPVLSMSAKAAQSLLAKMPTETAVAVGKAAAAVEKLTTLGFSASMIADTVKAVPRIGDAIKAGDTDTAAEMITSAALGGISAGLAAHHALGGDSKFPTWANDREVIAKSQQPERFHNLLADNFKREHIGLIRNKLDNFAAMAYGEEGGEKGESGIPTSVGTEQRVGAQTVNHPNAKEMSKRAELAKNALPSLIEQRDAALKAYHDDLEKRYQKNLTDEEYKAATERSSKLLAKYHSLTEDVQEASEEANPELRIGVIRKQTDGTNTVYLTNDAINLLHKIKSPGTNTDLQGVNFSQGNVDVLLRFLQEAQRNTLTRKTRAQAPMLEGIVDILKKAKAVAGDEGVTVVGMKGRGIGAAVYTAREEMLHGWQRSLSKGLIENHLDPEQFTRLRQAIPASVYAQLVRDGYEDQLQHMFVTEASAKMMAGKLKELNVSPGEATEFLDKYFNEVQSKWGKQALEKLDHTTGVATELRRRFAEVADETKRTPATDAEGTGRGTEPSEAVPSVAEGGQGRPEEGTGGTGGEGEVTPPPTPPGTPPATPPPGGDPPNGTIARLKAARERILADKNMTPTMRQFWSDVYLRAQNLPDEIKQLTTHLKDTEYPRLWKQYQDLKIVREKLADGTTNEGRENYMGSHIYKSDDSFMSSLLNKWNRRGAFDKASHLKPRQYATIEEALHAGFEPTRGLADAHVEYLRDVGRTLGHHAAEEALLSERTRDGMPMAVSPTMVRRVKGVIPNPDYDPAMAGTGEFIPGETRRGIRLESANLDPSKVPQDKIFHAIDGHLYLDVDDYRQGPETFSRRRFKDVARDPNDSTEGRVLTEKEPLMIHPDHLDAVNTAFDDNSWFRKNSLMKSALSLSTKAKKSLLSFSPFHWTTEYLRGLQMGLTPWEALNPPPITEASRAIQAKYSPSVLSGASRGEFREGVGENATLLKKLPGIGSTMHYLEEKLFGDNGYIDRLKGATFEKITKQLSERNKNWSNDQVEFAASRIVDAAFGGLNYKMLGVSLASRDALRLMFLAPDFTGSQILFAKYGFQPGGSAVAQSLGRIALYNFAAAQVLNLLVTGKVRMDHPFGLVSPDEKKIWTVRTMPQDMLHAMTNPREFTYNRLNPLITRTGMEVLTGRDEQGKRVDQEKQVHDLIRNIIPISLQAGLPGYHPEGQTWPTQVMRGLGATALPNRTTAENTAKLLASDHNPNGPVNAEHAARHELVLDLENKLQSKEITPDALGQYLKAGKISPKDMKDIIKNIDESRAMGEADARLYRYAQRLGPAEMLKVWDLATSNERRDLRPLLYKRFQAYEKEALPSDPVLRRLQAIFGPGVKVAPAK